MTKSQVYLEIPPDEDYPESIFVELTVTSTLDISMDTAISTNPTLSGKVVSDNAVNNPKTYNITGLISNTLNTALITTGRQRDVATNFALLQLIRDRRLLVTLYFDDYNLQAPIENCMITNLTFAKTSGMGSSYNVNMTIQEVLLSQEALISSEQFETDEVENQHSTKGTKKPVATTDVNSQSLITQGLNAGGTFFSQVGNEISNVISGDDE